jgi:hypothetical protein
MEAVTEGSTFSLEKIEEPCIKDKIIMKDLGIWLKW